MASIRLPTSARWCRSWRSPTAPITRAPAVTTEPHTTPSTPASRWRQWVTAAVVSTAPTTVYVGVVRGSSGVSAAR